MSLCNGNMPSNFAAEKIIIGLKDYMFNRNNAKNGAISRLLRERTPIYEKTCDIKIKNDGSVEETVENVLSAVKTRLKK